MANDFSFFVLLEFSELKLLMAITLWLAFQSTCWTLTRQPYYFIMTAFKHCSFLESTHPFGAEKPTTCQDFLTGQRQIIVILERENNKQEVPLPIATSTAYSMVSDKSMSLTIAYMYNCQLNNNNCPSLISLFSIDRDAATAGAAVTSLHNLLKGANIEIAL